MRVLGKSGATGCLMPADHALRMDFSPLSICKLVFGRHGPVHNVTKFECLLAGVGVSVA